MSLWRDITNLFVKKNLKLNKGAIVQVTSSANVTANVNFPR